MNGGVILIDGDAGHELGGRMRRGLIAAAGDVGDWTGLRMLAGTIVAFGGCGAYPGASMRRGTIGLFGRSAPTLLPTFRLACRTTLTMLCLVERQLREAAFAAATLARLGEPVELHHGDLLELGRGEVLISSPSGR
jgi:formylmethanofuran dehydrogenase subunit C